jgi:hypothetical protein
MTGKYAKLVGDADWIREQWMGLVVSEYPIYTPAIKIDSAGLSLLRQLKYEFPTNKI